MSPWAPKIMLLYAFCLHTIILGVIAYDPLRPRAPGVAFGLTPDYSTAVVHFKNGSSIPVAQVPGSPAYQAFMRRTTAGTPMEGSTLCKWITPVLDRLPAALGLDVPSCRSVDFISVKTLLSSLETAVETRLGTNFCFAELSVEDPLSYQSRLAEQALQHIGLRQIMPPGRRAKNVIRVFGPDSAPAYDEEPWPVLAVDYDTHWYNIGLYEIGEEGMVSPIEGFVHGQRFDVKNQLKAAKEELQNLHSKSGHIQHMFLYGEQRDNQGLLDLLTETLGSELVADARVDGSVWTSTSYMAEAAHIRMDDIQFEMDPASVGAFGCRWWSKLYRDSHEEL